jgi:hypothetical protein
MQIVALFFVALLLVGCGGGNQPQATAPTQDTTRPAVVEVSFSKEVLPILQQNCMPCHSGGADAKSKYVLTNYEGVMGTGKDTVANVLPGKPDSCQLGQMLASGRMPPTGRLEAAKFDLIVKWIAQGAKNN